jgi:hypothetical protein
MEVGRELVKPVEHRADPVPSDPLQEFLLRGNRAARLLTEHVDDGTGHCSVCSQGGQVGHVRWPCQLATAAQRAAERLAH